MPYTPGRRAVQGEAAMTTAVGDFPSGYDEAEDKAHREALESVPGHDTTLTDETLVLDAILHMAVSHDTVCQYYEDRLARKIGVRGDQARCDGDDSELNDYVFGAVQLCAALAPAAIRRIPAPVFAKAIARSDEILTLADDELAAFMRPIFEESGLGERFEVRSGYQVYVGESRKDAA
jgi:hypothetical protein